MKTPKPVLHGPDHVPGGADPIPDWPTGGFTPTSVKIGPCSPVSLNGTGSRVNAPWDGTQTGTALIDISTPTVPTFIAAGTYAVTVNADLSTTSSGSTGDMVGILEFASTHGALQFSATCPARTTLYNPSLSISAVVTVAAGAAFDLQLGSKTGSTEDGSIENAFIVRLS